MYETTRSGAIRCALSMAVVLVGSSAHEARAQYDNRDRYQVVRTALAEAAPHTDATASGYAGVAFDTPSTPFNFWDYDTPHWRSFGALNVAQLIFGTRAAGLGNGAWGASPIGTPCTYNNVFGNQTRTYGLVADLRDYVDSAVAYLACATTSHVMYQEFLETVRTCGNQCYVDIASLFEGNAATGHIRAQLVSAINRWLVGKPADARMIVRITVGYPNNVHIGAEIAPFDNVVTAGAGRVEVFGMAFARGWVLGTGHWSHAKLFAVHSLTNPVSYRAVIGGQNHYNDYDNDRPPFDSNTMIRGRAAAVLPSLQMDAALTRFQAQQGNDWIGRSTRWVNGALRSQRTFRWNDAGHGNVSFERFSVAALGAPGITNTNPRSIPGGLANATQRAIVSLIDMGWFSVRDRGRTISRSLAALIRAEAWGNHIRIWQQTICFSRQFCGVRHDLTPMGEVVRRALNSARWGHETQLWLLTSDNQISNVGYLSVTPAQGWSSLYRTGERIACNGNAYRPGWGNLANFRPPRGGGTCRQAVRRALNARLMWRMSTAYINGFPNRERVGIHHKVVIFRSDAMFQGSYNIYSSGGVEAQVNRYDSELVENGAILFDPSYVQWHRIAFDEAWQNARPIVGTESGIP